MNIPWVESPLFGKLLAEANLSERDRERVLHYAEEGYVIFDFPSERLDAFAEEIQEKMMKPEGQLAVNTTMMARRRLQDAWKTSEAVRALATNEGVLSLLRLFYRREPIPFQTLNFPVGTEQATHSDTIHFHCVPHRFMCGVWVALEDIDDANGPLHIYPGSHRLPIWDMHDLGLPAGRESYHAYEETVRDLIREMHLQKKQVHLKKGQALVWAANLLHGGEPIRDPARTRFSQVTHYFFENCLYYTPMHSDPYLGKVAIRQMTNIIDGKPVPNVYAGEALCPETIDRLRSSTSNPSTGATARGILKRIVRKMLR